MPVLFLYANDLTVNSKDLSMQVAQWDRQNKASRTSPPWRVCVLLFDNCFLCLALISLKIMVVKCFSMDIIFDKPIHHTYLFRDQVSLRPLIDQKTDA